MEKAGIDPATAAPSQPDRLDGSRSDHSAGSKASASWRALRQRFGLTRSTGIGKRERLLLSSFHSSVSACDCLLEKLRLFQWGWQGGVEIVQYATFFYGCCVLYDFNTPLVDKQSVCGGRDVASPFLVSSDSCFVYFLVIVLRTLNPFLFYASLVLICSSAVHKSTNIRHACSVVQLFS